MGKDKFYKQIEFEDSLKNLRNQMSYMPEEVLREEKNSLKEYANSVELVEDSFKDSLLFYSRFNSFLVFSTCSLIGLGLIATPLIILGLINGVFATFCLCVQKSDEKYLPFWSHHLCVVNEAINDIDSFLEEKYEVNNDKHESKLEKGTSINNRFLREQIENENKDNKDNENKNDNNNGLNL